MNRPRWNKVTSVALVVVLVVMLAVSLLSQPAYADPGPGWYDAAWKYRKRITIDNTMVSGSSNLSNFPLLISITDTDLADDAQNDGDDILFTSSDATTRLDHEIEYFDGSSGALQAWVEVPTLYYNQDTVVYIYYGNPGVSNQQNATGTWDANYKGVWHLSEDPSGSPPQMGDSTTNNNNMTSSGAMTSADQVTGQIDGSLELDATDDYISQVYDNDFDFGTGSFTTSGWFKTSGAAGGSTDLSVRVNQSSDDAEEDIADGSILLLSSDLELIYDTGNLQNQEVGMRFQSMTIPPGATITNAYIQFTTESTRSGTTNLAVHGEDTDDAPTFTSTAYDISNRTKTSAAVAWSNIPPWSTSGEAGVNQQTPDISSIIQEIVDRAGWASGNSLAIIITGSGTREAESYDGDAPAAPELVVTYTSPLYLLSRYDSDQGFKVWMEGSGKVSFGIDDDASWEPKVKITSTNTYDDNSWHYYTAVKEGNSAVRLYIDGNQVAADTSLGEAGSVSVRISQSSDDAEESLGNGYDGYMDLISTDLELIYEVEYDLNQEVGMRFQNMTIPQEATITDAYIQFTVDETDSGTTNLTIYGEDTNNAPTFTNGASSYNITTRTKTSTSVAWNNVPPWNVYRYRRR